MAQETLSFGARLVLFFLLPFQVLFDGARAFRVQQALPPNTSERPKELKGHVADERKVAHKDADGLKKIERAFKDLEEVLEKERAEHASKVDQLEKKNAALIDDVERERDELEAQRKATDEAVQKASDDDTAALQLLGIFQRDGRLVDFLMEDVKGFSDAEVGGAARQVHEGCSKALQEYFTLEPVRDEEEDAAIQVKPGFDAHLLRLTGNVTGKAPYEGHLAHPGWKVVKRSLPVLADREYAYVISPAEVEL
ncbi:MAG: DUF2760 domain-containing protein [Deltaproteobacteria bacterium]|nr:DUF2760 domain-containing protein [Deltaproteobacteria bacterium]